MFTNTIMITAAIAPYFAFGNATPLIFVGGKFFSSSLIVNKKKGTVKITAPLI